MTIAHETVYVLQRTLVTAGRDTPRSADLLAESSRITLRDAAVVTATVRPLIGRSHEESVLDPASAAQTALAIDAEFARVEGELRRLLSRQREIVAELCAIAAQTS